MLFRSVQFLRAESGGYWTGANFEGERVRRRRRAVPRGTAHVELGGGRARRRTRSPATGPTAGLFRGERLPEGLTADELLAAGVEIERERSPRPHRLTAPLANRRR